MLHSQAQESHLLVWIVVRCWNRLQQTHPGRELGLVMWRHSEGPKVWLGPQLRVYGARVLCINLIIKTHKVCVCVGGGTASTKACHSPCAYSRCSSAWGTLVTWAQKELGLKSKPITRAKDNGSRVKGNASNSLFCEHTHQMTGDIIECMYWWTISWEKYTVVPFPKGALQSCLPHTTP